MNNNHSLFNYNYTIKILQIIIVSVLSFNLLINYSLYSESEIYLPFPDLPLEILQPESNINPIHSNPVSYPPNQSSSIDSTSHTNHSVSTPSSLDEQYITGDSNDLSPISKNTSNKNNTIRTHSKSNQYNNKNIHSEFSISADSSPTIKSHSNLDPMQNNKSFQKVNSLKSNQQSSGILSNIDPEDKRNEKSKIIDNTKDELSVPPPSEEEIKSFQESMVRIRNQEKSNPKKSLEDYQLLLNQFKHPILSSKIIISIAWNYFHRGLYFDSLDSTIQILEDPKMVNYNEYPTALYLAYVIHGKPWSGKSEGFQNRYSEIFHKNVNAGKENFKTSHYRNLIPNSNIN